MKQDFILRKLIVLQDVCWVDYYYRLSCAGPAAGIPLTSATEAPRRWGLLTRLAFACSI